MAVKQAVRSSLAADVRRMGQVKGVERFAAARRVVAAAERSPARVARHFGALAALLNGSCKIMKWNAMRAVGLLSGEADAQRVGDALEVLRAAVTGPEMISAATAAKALAGIAHRRPELTDRVLDAVLAAEHARYRTPECRNVVLGHVLDGLQALGPQTCSRPPVRAFIERQTRNSRPAVARRARRMLAMRNGNKEKEPVAFAPAPIM